MTRWFREYNRIFILVFMSALLVVFLIGDAVGRGVGGGGGGREMTLGTAFDGEDVSAADVRRVGAKMEIARAFGAGIPVFGRENANLAMYLLVREAQRLGVRVSPGEIKAELQSAPNADQLINEVRRRKSVSLDQIWDALATVESVLRVQRLQLAAVGYSTPRAEADFRQSRQGVSLAYSVIQSRALTDDVAEPTEEELQALFAEGKDRQENHTTDEMVFGYQREPRVKIEVLTIDPQEIVRTVSIRDSAAQRFFQSNPQRYMTGGQMPTYEEVREQVREDYRLHKAREVAQTAVNEMYATAERPWLGNERDEQGFRKAPEESVSFQELRDRYSDRFDVTYYESDVLTKSELNASKPEIPRFRQAAVSTETGPLGVAEAAFRTKGVFEPGQDETLPSYNVGEPLVAVRGRRNFQTRQLEPEQAYLFRVVEVQPARPPESLDAVRDEVREDAKLIKAHEMAADLTRQLVEQARSAGLRNTMSDNQMVRELIGGVVEEIKAETGEPLPTDQYLVDTQAKTLPNPLTRRGFPNLRSVGDRQAVRDAIFEYLDEHPDVELPAVTSVDLPGEFKHVLVQIDSVEPIFYGQFLAQQDQLMRSKMSQQVRELQREWYSVDNVLARTGYVPSESTQ